MAPPHLRRARSRPTRTASQISNWFPGRRTAVRMPDRERERLMLKLGKVSRSITVDEENLAAHHEMRRQLWTQLRNLDDPPTIQALADQSGCSDTAVIKGLNKYRAEHGDDA